MRRSNLAARLTARVCPRVTLLAFASLSALLLLAWPGPGGAAGIYVIDSRIDRDGVSALAPTFIATPGERALIVYQGERDIEVAMTVVPREGGGGDALDVRIEIIENMEVMDARLDVTLGRPGTVTIGEREVSVLVREQAPLADSAPGSGSAPASADAGTAGTAGANGADPGDEGAGSDGANAGASAQDEAVAE